MARREILRRVFRDSLDLMQHCPITGSGSAPFDSLPFLAIAGELTFVARDEC